MTRRQVRTVVFGLLLGGLGGLLLRAVTFAAAAAVLTGSASLLAERLARFAALDPVYTRAALRTLGDLHLQGVAVAAPLGDGLHAQWPALFVEPARAHGGVLRVVLTPGSAVLGRLVAATASQTTVLALGLLLLRRGAAHPHWGLVAAAVAAQWQVIQAVVRTPPSFTELDATGLSFAVNVLLPDVFGRRAVVSDLANVVPTRLLAACLAALALALAYLLASTAVGLVIAVGRARRPRQTLGSPHAGRRPVGRLSIVVPTLLVAVASLSVAAFASPRPAVAENALAPAFQAVSAPPNRTVRARRPVQASKPTPAGHLPVPDDWRGSPSFALEAGAPSVVRVIGSRYRYTYQVNGEPEVIHGMGLNTQYATQLSPDQRRERLDADFALMRRLGVNTVLGWDPAEFDETLFALAHEHNLGVVPPFDLDPAADYTDASYRARLTQDVLAWVNRYRSQPALRMWGLGNEVLHKIVHPSWVGPQNPARDRNARAFAAWLVETADAIHDVDPDHPVTYREAEDAFVPWIAQAVKQRGGPRPWFVFGTNCYSDHLRDLVESWPDQGLDVPLWVSEFAPGGMAPGERAGGFREMWGYVRERPDTVLGGAVYAWTRNGPEEIDRTMGITNDGVPVDPTLLQTLADLFDAPTSEH